MRSTVTSHQKVTVTDGEQSSQLIHLRRCRKLLKNWSVDHFTVDVLQSIRHLTQIGRWKSSINECLLSGPKKKKSSFWSVVFSHCLLQQPAVSPSECDVRQKVDFIRQPVMTSSVVEWRRSSKTLPRAKLAPKKGHNHCWWSAPRLMHYSFLDSSESIASEKCAQQSDEGHGKLQFLWPALDHRGGPGLPHEDPQLTSPSQHFRIWTSCASFATFTWPLVNQLPLVKASLQLFVGKTLSQPAGSRKCFPRVLQMLKHRFLLYGNKQTYFSLAKMCLL